MTRRLAFAAVGALLLALFAFAGVASAQTVIESSTIDNGYPSTLTFKLNARADSEITDVTLNYAITGRGTSALGKPSDFTPGKSVSVSIPVQTNSANSYIPVGSEFVYHWEITTADALTRMTVSTIFRTLMDTDSRSPSGNSSQYKSLHFLSRHKRNRTSLFRPT